MSESIRTRWISLGVAIVLAIAAANFRVAARQGVSSISESLYSDLAWRCIGPFDGGVVKSVSGVSGVPGVYYVTTDSAPDETVWKSTDAGTSWVQSEHAEYMSLPSQRDPRQWTDPSNPRRIAKVDELGIAVSLDGGATWTASHNLPIANVRKLDPRERPRKAVRPQDQIGTAPVSVIVADAVRPELLFAATSNGVYVSFDN